MAVGSAHMFPDFLTPVLTQLSFQSHRLLFLTCFSRGDSRKYAGKKVRLNRVSNLQPPGDNSEMPTTEPPGRGWWNKNPAVSYSVEPKSDCTFLIPTVHKGITLFTLRVNPDI